MRVYSPHYQHKSSRTELKAAVFALFLCLCLITVISLSIVNMGPLIIGTEMNANGTVEYLCLGNHCENLTPMDW